MATVFSAALLGVLRIVVLTVGEEDPDVVAGARALGADTVVTTRGPRRSRRKTACATSRSCLSKTPPA